MAELSVTAAAIFVVLLGATRSAGAQDPAAAKTANPPDVRSQEVLVRVCGDCHEWQRTVDSRRTKAQWVSLIDDMITRGAVGTDADFDVVLDYVLRHSAFVNVNKAPADELTIVMGLTTEEAEAIVAYRVKVGKFADFEALKQVKGVDPKKLDAARQSLLY